MPEVAKAREVHALMRAGALDGLSIGFRTVKGRRDRASRRAPAGEDRPVGDLGRHLSAAARGARRLHEGARLSPALPTERDFERWLTRDAGLTRSEARALMSAGFNGLKALRDAGRGSTEEAQLAARMREAARSLRYNL